MTFIVNNTTLPNPLDLIAPHSCRGCGRIGAPLCECCKKHIIIEHQKFRKATKNKHSNLYAINYREGLLNTLIHAYKYDSVRALGKTFANLLDKILPPLPKDTYLVPLPTATNHIRTRGFDHTLLIAKHLAKIRHLKIERALIREKNSVQVGTNRATRVVQAKSAYNIDPKFKPRENATYALLDDVLTTGASIDAASKKLREAGVLSEIVILLSISRD